MFIKLSSVIWGLPLSIQSFGNRTQKTNIEKKQVINARSKGNTPPFSH